MRIICFLFVFFCYQQLKAQTIHVSGEVTKQLDLTKEDLAKMKRTTVTAKDKDGRDHIYKGVAVADILHLAGVTTGAQLRGASLSKYLLVTCADGYAVVFSLAELDESFTDKVVILADESDGKLLPVDKGPWRIVVPGEKKPARSCFKVTSFNIGFAR
jgi:DMSO/TMAO reductase YedYZ molybdopterin-dependent catalytic subunit